MLDNIRHQLQDRNIKKVADATGISRQTITQIRDGVNTNPMLSTIIALHEYFEKQSQVVRNDD